MIIRFSFFTTKQIDLYARRCNELLQRKLVHAIYHDSNGYHVEANGDQDEITELANIIGQSFPLSCSITGTDISAVPSFKGSSKLLTTSESVDYVHYCEQCKDDFTHLCPVCESAIINAITVNEQAVIPSDTQQLLQSTEVLVEQKPLTLQSLYGSHIVNETWLPLTDIEPHQQRMVFTSIEALQNACFVTERDLQLLLSIEKPSLRLAIKPDFKQKYQLPLDTYIVSLPAHKLAYTIATYCAGQDIHAFVLDGDDTSPHILKFGTDILYFDNAPQPESLITHQPIHTSVAALGLNAQWKKGTLSIKRDNNPHPLSKPEMSAAYALENLLQRDRFPKKCAVLYLDNRYPSGLLHRIDNKKTYDYQWLFEAPQYSKEIILRDLLNQITELDPTSTQLVARFIEANGQRIANAPTANGSLSDMLGLLAIILGLSDNGATLVQASNSAVATVISNKFENLPRVEFELITKGDTLEIDWVKAFQSVLSYYVAMPDDNKVIVAGFLDSLADYLCAWIERFDQHLGFEKLTLAGNEFDNPIFLELLRLRLSKNVQLTHSYDSDLTAMNLVFGSMFVANDAQLTR
ncbi:hypothetical protein [Vibrio gallicus]|uniref:hypothetical protein n=1 Tax=Vibrio gallicus TaxID=190897 RepID=UPI0021C3D6EB|nr:hypothetical protein [Vibrio gallicus]